MQVGQFAYRASNVIAVVALALSAFNFAAAAASAAPKVRPPVDEQRWNETWRESLKNDLFEEATIVSDPERISIGAPYRAEDAAIVPINIRLGASLGSEAEKLTLIIDENPSPVAGEFTFGRGAGRGDKILALRVRVNSYSFVRVVVETYDGKTFMNKAFVKAAGGCSAPANKDEEAARATLGKMKLRKLAHTASKPALAQLMIKHPQYSGFQMDQLTGYYTPAEFVDEISVKLGDELIFSMTGGISISENPNFRFSYDESVSGQLSVRAKDTEERVFKQSAERRSALRQYHSEKVE